MAEINTKDMAEPVTEKVVRLETQMTNITGEIAEIKGLVKELIVKVDNITNLQVEVAALKKEVADLKARTFRNGLVFPTVSAVAGAILTLLVSFYLTHINR